MYIQWMKIENYRNLDSLTLHFNEQANFFVGENAIGKSNFLDLLSIITAGTICQESDFTNPTRPIKVTAHIVNYHPYREVTLLFRQKVSDLFPNLYVVGHNGLKQVKLSHVKKAFYTRHFTNDTWPDTEVKDMLESLQTSCKNIECQETLLSSIIALLGPRGTIKKVGTTKDNMRIIGQVALKLLGEIYNKLHSHAIQPNQLKIKGEDGKFYLPLWIGIDEPEIHLNPSAQRAVIKFYRQIIQNKNESFSYLLKKLFNIDGLEGQLFIATHSTEALEDDYRTIIRLYHDKNTHINAACGSTFNFNQEVEKHLVMHFPEAKEALYSKCALIVEGETEYGSFKHFGSAIGIDFDYYSICLINARGESSISKLTKLLQAFDIPVVALYDADVKPVHGHKNPNIFYTDQLCFEMDVVDYLLKTHRRYILDQAIGNLLNGESGTVTRDMLKRACNKLAWPYDLPSRRHLSTLKHIDLPLLRLYYFAWFYSNKGVFVGRELAKLMTASDVPPAFKRVIKRASMIILEQEIDPIRIGR